MQAEKQELTILFCDLLGSTELSEKLSLDEFLEVMQTYHDCLYQCISEHYGYLAQHLGDGIMAYFGYPVKFPSAPVQAIKSGLTLLARIPEMVESRLKKYQLQLTVRISVHTGSVVMADLGIGNRKERLALGGTPNIAARLQSLAPLNSIVVSEQTYELTKDHFDFYELGCFTIRGITGKLTCYQPVHLRN